MTRRLVLFAKPPLTGVSKTRLAARLGDEAAARIAEAMLLDTIAMCELVVPSHGSRPDLVVAWTVDDGWFTSNLPDCWRRLQQRGGSLDERLDSALADLDPRPGDVTVFLGMDAPQVPVEWFAQALAELDRADVVLGPSEDGGYYLVGVRGRWPAGILAGVRWSTEYAAGDTIAAFEGAGLGTGMLPVCYDVDEYADLARLIGDLAEMPPTALRNLRETARELGLGP